jgi:AcrR family transcriptional regulator
MPSTKKNKRPATRGLRVGGRSERVVTAVLRAAAEELARDGYAGFQIEEVARAAGVNRTSIYRRWPTKALLVEATLRELSPFRHTVAATGDLAADFLRLLKMVLPWLNSTQGRGLRRMVQHGASAPELRRIVDALREESLAPWYAAIGQAKQRGEIARDVDARLLTQMILAPVAARLDVGERVSQRMLIDIVRIVLKGARPEPKKRAK